LGLLLANQLKAHGGIFLSLTCQPITSARMRGLAARRFENKSPIPKKIHGGIFLGHTPDCRGGKAVREANGGSLATGTPESGEWKGINSRLQPTNECKIRNTVQKIKKKPRLALSFKAPAGRYKKVRRN